MANFKRALGSGSESSDGFGFDGATLAVLGDASATFWPLIAGSVVLLILMLRGDHASVIPVGAGMMLLQAWQSGMFG